MRVGPGGGRRPRGVRAPVRHSRGRPPRFLARSTSTPRSLSRLRDLLLQAFASLWFLPLFLTAVLAGAAFAIVGFDLWLDARLGEGPGDAAPLFLGAGVDGARSMLAAIAGALVTSSGVILSGVLVALSITAGQYSSRVLRTFTANRLHQGALGFLLGSLVYTLVVLRAVGVGPERDFVPETAVAVALVLAVASVGALLAFAHGVARSIQASELLATTAADVVASMEALFGHDAGGQGEREQVLEPPLPPDRVGVAARRSGYLRAADGAALAKVAERREGVVVVEKRVGAFVVAGEVLVSFAGRDELGDGDRDDLLAALRIGSFRTPEQDPAFGVRQLVDIALKALSPGVNDTTTAQMAAQRILEALVVPARSPLRPSRVTRGGALRVVIPRRDFTGLLELAYEQLLRAAEHAPHVLAEVVEGWLVLEDAARRAGADHARAALLEFARGLRPWLEGAARREPLVADHRRVEVALARLLGRPGTGADGRPG